MASVFLIALLGGSAFLVGSVLRFLHPAREAGLSGPAQGADPGGNIFQIIGDPRSGFPGKERVTIACMGIDDNWTNSDEVYTAGARTDTLFLLTLDLVTKKATMLSIPRDTYVHIAGTDRSDKINSAFSTGGPERTDATIQQWIGVTPDYYAVLDIDATKRMVDALGGVDVDVEHPLNYDDDWGHLHVHLQPGEQHLDGEQAVGFARYRHGNHGAPTPEDGDERRMYRQHVLMQAMTARAKSFSNFLQANHLIDVGLSCIRTNLSRAQMLDLAVLFHGIDQDHDIVAASLVGQDSRGPGGQYVMRVDDRTAQLYADWLVRGDEGAGHALTAVQIANSTLTPGLASRAVDAMHAAGFSDSAISSAVTQPRAPHTTIVDRGVADRQAAADVAQTLGLPDAAITRDPASPNRLGWTPPPTIQVNLGADYAALHRVQAASASPQ